MDEVGGDVAGKSSRPYTAVSIVGLAYFLAFACYGGTDGLQTASDGDLSKSCVMAVICITSIASSVLLTPAFVVRLSPNTALCVAWGSHALYAMANLYPTAWTLVPAAVIVGATFPAVAVAQGVYATALVDRWCGRQVADDDAEDRLTGVNRSPCADTCGCTTRATDDNERRQNVFVVFNSILLVRLNNTSNNRLSIMKLLLFALLRNNGCTIHRCLSAAFCHFFASRYHEKNKN